MNLPYIFTSGIIVVILFLIGLFYTFWEFQKMKQHPEDFTDEPNKNVTVEQKKAQ
ncbi:hypothetical protein BH23BAC3_BH23BAC3_02410 [soil metagenome]